MLTTEILNKKENKQNFYVELIAKREINLYPQVTGFTGHCCNGADHNYKNRVTT